ncbi:MAG: hypothetical protein QHC40_05330 [Sphingobium sp.]|nr:hypothetical protein [Sphingobium sp.]
MLEIKPPALTPAEWREVKQTLSGIADCGCAGQSRAAAPRGRIGKAIDALIGPSTAAAPLPPRLDAVRRFTCDSARMGRVAQEHLPALAAQGFSRAQIDAIALLGA